MRRLALVGLLVLAACGSSGKHVAVRSDTASTAAAPSSSSPAVASTSTSTSAAPDTASDRGPHPHFATPEAAMTYLAAAWNAKDLVSEKHVTDPGARVQLDEMRSEAVNLRFNRCDRHVQDGTDMGDYICYFKHDYPKDTPTTMAGGIGDSTVLVGPADTPGWYMTVFQGCG